eukprot:jgi/Ulvmu1/4924/UM203_0003.1
MPQLQKGLSGDSVGRKRKHGIIHPALALNGGFVDPVHCKIDVSASLIPLLSTKPFQRLRRLSQLGICNQIFPRANHTRFEHSLGVGHLARRWGERLSQQLEPALLSEFSESECAASDVDLLRLELAGYAHDLGHGPLSHLFERLLATRACELEAEAEELYISDSNAEAAHAKLDQAERLKSWEHEQVSLDMLDMAVAEIRNKGDLPVDHFLNDDRNIFAVKAMITGSDGGNDVLLSKAWLYTIVNNSQSGLDVDKMDYLCRDQLYTDVMPPDCAFRTAADVDRLLDHARVVAVDGPNGSRTEIAFKLDEAHSASLQPHVEVAAQRLVQASCAVKLLDGLFQTRAAMHEGCYQSERVLAIEETVIRFMKRPQGAPAELLAACAAPRCTAQPSLVLGADDAIIDQLLPPAVDVDGGLPAAQLCGDDGRAVCVVSARLIPGEVSRGRTGRALQQLVEQRVMNPLRAELGKDLIGSSAKSGQCSLQSESTLWVKVADCHEGAKDTKAITRVNFCSSQATAEGHIVKLPEGIVASGLSQPPRRCLCSVHAWQAPGATTADATALQRLQAAFQRHWDAWLLSAADSGQSTAPCRPVSLYCCVSQAGRSATTASAAHAVTVQRPLGPAADTVQKSHEHVSIFDTDGGEGKAAWHARECMGLSAQHLCKDKAVASQQLSQAFSSQASTQVFSMPAVFACGSQLASQASSHAAWPPHSAAAGAAAVPDVLPAAVRSTGHAARQSEQPPVQMEQPVVRLHSQLELSPENVAKQPAAADAVAATQPRRKKRGGMMDLLREHEKRPYGRAPA